MNDTLRDQYVDAQQSKVTQDWHKTGSVSYLQGKQIRPPTTSGKELVSWGYKDSLISSDIKRRQTQNLKFKDEEMQTLWESTKNPLSFEDDTHNLNKDEKMEMLWESTKLQRIWWQFLLWFSSRWIACSCFRDQIECLHSGFFVQLMSP